ncbi:hypothetical protein HID58_010132 [Brassica napus]|uniref:RNase H type-1 domain-containing protein n=1 Tax=Brassica napus TaxID=3708 RepID=A0ABQ8DUE8_BRANA|nr:hypothetical protein HID58_010132 [Brassica napus]
MKKKPNVEDPSESAARKERFRQAEEQGQIKETAEAMVRAELEAQTQELQGLEEPGIRIPATHRISFPPATETHVERIPASRRLALAPPPVSEKGRLPIAARLGTTKLIKPSETGGDPDATSKRKPGRPPGKRKVLASPRTGAGTNPRRRKPQQTNAPKCKKKLIPDTTTSEKIPKARHIPFVEELDSRGMIELRELWNYVKTKPCLPPTGITSGHLAPWIMWEIWTARNKLVFSNLRGETGESLSRAIRMAREWQEGQTKETQTRRTSQPKVIIDTGTILRTDAAWNEESSRAGLGWILTQDAITSSLAIIAENVPSPLMAEGLALREALQKSRELGIKVLNVESDSKNLIASVTNNKSNDKKKRWKLRFMYHIRVMIKYVCGV